MVLDSFSNVKYIFIDESGDLGQYGSEYFTIVALTTSDIKKIGRIIKKVRQRIMKKKLKNLSEIKANNSNEIIRKYVLNSLINCNCLISSIVIPKSKIKQELYGSKNKLYNYLCGVLFSHIDLNVSYLEIIIDKKDSNKLLREDFNHYISEKIKEMVKIKFSITHLDSQASNELQVVDFVAWAINRKYSHKDDTYYNIIEKLICNEDKQEIWK